jgi:hypothetical protein
MSIIVDHQLPEAADGGPEIDDSAGKSEASR